MNFYTTFYTTYFKWKCTAGSPEDDGSLSCWIVKFNVKHNIVEVEVVVLLTYCKVLGNHTIVALKSLLLCWHNLQYAVAILSVWLKVNAFTRFLCLIVKTYIVARTNARNFNLCHKIVVCNMFVISTI